MSPDHDIMRDEPVEPDCALCGGTGEVLIEDPDGNRSDEACPHCMQQAHEADTARLRAALARSEEERGRMRALLTYARGEFATVSGQAFAAEAIRRIDAALSTPDSSEAKA